MAEMSPEEFAKSRLSASDWKIFDSMCKARDRKRARDEEQSTLEGVEQRNALDEITWSRPMNAYQASRIAAKIATDEMHELREAERAVAPYVGGMTFDSAFSAYRAGLGQLGVSPAELRGLGVDEMRVLLKHIAPRPGVSRPRSAPMAFDTRASASLAFLDSIPRPRDISGPNDRR